MLSQPPQGASYRAHLILGDDPRPEPGQQLPACMGHTGVSICTPPPDHPPRAEVRQFPSICWARVWRRKHDLVSMLRNAYWRRHNIPDGYRTSAAFEAGCHWVLCGASDNLDVDCPCTPEYRSWFKDQMASGRAQLPPLDAPAPT